MSSAASSMIAVDRRHLRNALAIAAVACALGAPSLARAAAPAPAEELFREGRALLDAKRYDEACPKLAESQRLEPGAGTLLALALCHEGQGKPATASMELKRASELGRRNGRADLAAAADKRARALEASVPHLVVQLPEGEGSTYDVRCDDQPIAASDLGAPIPMDPGEHRIDVTAHGKTARSYVVRISGAGTVEIVVDALEDLRPTAASNVAPAPPKTRARASGPVLGVPADPSRDEGRGGAQRTTGLVLVGAGIVGLGAGAYFGGRALSQSGEAKRTCPKAGSCSDNGGAANDRAKTSFKVSVISVAAGAGALTLGAIVYFLAPNDASSQGAGKPPRATARVIPSIDPSGGSLGLVGTF